MMPSHETLVYIAKSYRLFYLIALSIVVLAYAYWPAKKGDFERAAKAILDDEDRPWG